MGQSRVCSAGGSIENEHIQKRVIRNRHGEGRVARRRAAEAAKDGKRRETA